MEYLESLHFFASKIGSAIFIAFASLTLLAAFLFGYQEIRHSKYLNGTKKSFTSRTGILFILSLIGYLSVVGIHHWYIESIDGSFYAWMTYQGMVIIVVTFLVKALKAIFK